MPFLFDGIHWEFFIRHMDDQTYEKSPEGISYKPMANLINIYRG
jgi:hypothetical protein